jgi:hypothetical protein
MDPMDPNPITRRAFTRVAVAAGTAAAFCWDSRRREDARREDVMEEALEMLDGTGPEWQRFSNHGPMAAEALVRLRREEAVIDWVRRYKTRLEPFPAAKARIDPQHWEAALGNGAFADWKAFFVEECQQKPWREALALWAPRLAPGLTAAATHGLIRTAHATRSLGSRETKVRIRELATGLGFWAARYQRLPDAAAASRPKPTDFVRALERVETYRPARTPPAGTIADSLAALGQFPPFAGVADLADTTGDASRGISALTACFAGVYLAHSQEYAVAFVHSVTAPSALRLLLPHLPPAAAGPALRYAWQAAAGLYATYGNPKNRPALPESRPKAEDLADRAVRSGNEHAIKLTEACLREHAIAPNPIYLAAAADAVSRL